MEYIRWKTNRQIQSANQNIISRQLRQQQQQETQRQQHQLQRMQQEQHQ
jgi:hypothetical protein